METCQGTSKETRGDIIGEGKKESKGGYIANTYSRASISVARGRGALSSSPRRKRKRERKRVQGDRQEMGPRSP